MCWELYREAESAEMLVVMVTVSDCVCWNDEVGVGLYAALNNSSRALKKGLRRGRRGAQTFRTFRR